MIRKKNQLWISGLLALYLSSPPLEGTSFGQCLDCVPNFSPAFGESYGSIAPDGTGYYVYRGPNGTYDTTYLGPYRMQQYVDFSNVPIYYGPMSQRYLLQSPAIWRQNGVNNSRKNNERADVSANPTMGSGNKKTDRLPVASKSAKTVSKSRAVVDAEDKKMKELAENSKPTPFVLDENGRLPIWLVSATEFIDRFAKSGDVGDALAACERLTTTRTGLPSDIYTRTAVFAFLEGRELDEVAKYIELATQQGTRLSSRNLPGGSLEKYLSPSERRKFMDQVARYRSKFAEGVISDEHKKVIEALLTL